MLKDKSQSQSKQLDSLSTSFSIVVNTMKDSNEDDLQSSISLIQNTEKENSGEVLALEDSPEMKKLRKLSEEYRSIIETLGKIEATNKDIENLLVEKPYVKYLNYKNPQLDTQVIKDTNEFTKNAGIIMSYFKDQTVLSIEESTVIYDLVADVVSAFYSDFDEFYVSSIEAKLDKLDSTQNKLENLNTDNLPDSIKEGHRAHVEELDAGVKDLRVLVQAMRDKDYYFLLSFAQSLDTATSSVVASEEVALSEAITFWQENETIRSVPGLVKSWENFGTSIK